MHQDGAAAALGRRHDRLDAVGRQHAEGRPVDVGHQDALHAARQQRDAGPPLSLGGDHVGQRLRRGHRSRRQVQHATQRGGHEALHRFAQASGRQRRAESAGIGQRFGQQLAGRRVEPRTLATVAYRRAIVRQQIAVRDARRTGGDASPATETAVEIRLDVAGGQFAFEHVLHQVDAASRRVHFLAQDLIRGAGRQAQSAMHARLDGLRHRGSARSEFRRVDVVLHLRLPKLARRVQGTFDPLGQHHAAAHADEGIAARPQHAQTNQPHAGQHGPN